MHLRKAVFVPVCSCSHSNSHLTVSTLFDLEKLTVYTRSKEFNRKIYEFLKFSQLDRTTNDQLRRASFSIMLNIAEGSGRFSRADKKNFYIIARGSTFECAAIFDYLKDISVIDASQFSEFYCFLDELSRMLFSMIKKLQGPQI